MPQCAEQLGHTLHQVCYLPRLEDAPTLELVDAIQTHQDKQHGTDVIGDAYNIPDLLPDNPEGFGPHELFVHTVELMCLSAVHHHAITTD